MPIYKSHGTGKYNPKKFASIGKNVVIEEGVLIFHPENLEIGDDVYIGHNSVINAYHNGQMKISSGVWIGSGCFFHAAGGITIEENVGIGPGVKVLTSSHDLKRDDLGPIINLPIKRAAVLIGGGSDLGIGSIILPGVNIGEGTQVGAGAVVREDTRRFSIVAGVPAREIGLRESIHEKVERQKGFLVKHLYSWLIHLIRFCFDLIFLALFPVVFIYSWGRLFLKKAFNLSPSIIISPLGAPLPFFNTKALRKAGFKSDNIAYDCPAFFRPISFGLVLSNRFLLKMGNYLTDYTFLFLYSLLFYDIFEFPFSGGLLCFSHLRKIELPILKILAKKVFVYGYGADCKLLSDVRKEAQDLGLKYNTAMDRNEETTETNTERNILANVNRAKKYADVLIAGADLIHLGKKAIMLPLAVDLSLWKYSPPRKHSKVLVLHSTNHRSHKGSRFIFDICEKLSANLPIEMLMVEKKTMAECQKIYPQADIFIPDVITGWHGLVAIEAMATGRPVITYLRDDFMKFHAYYAKKIPAVSANPDTLAREITKLVRDKKLREKLGLAGREYVQRYHSLEFVGKLRKIIIEHIWQGKPIDQKIFERELKKQKLI